MIKVFGTSSRIAENAALELNLQFEEWKKSFGNNSIEITSFFTTSNSNGWLLTVQYNILRF